MPNPFETNAKFADWSSRIRKTTAIVGSPAAAAETIIAQLTIPDDLPVADGVHLDGWAAFTVGTNGTACTLRLRQTNTGGTLIASTGALTGGVAAAALLAQDIAGFDGAVVLPNQVYVLTLQVTAGSAISTVSGTYLRAIVV